MYQHQDGKNVKRTEAEFPSAARVRTPSGIVRMRGKYGIPGCHLKTGTDAAIAGAGSTVLFGTVYLCSAPVKVLQVYVIEDI